VEAAVAILRQKDSALPPTGDGAAPTFRVGIHFGPTKVDSDGDRQGDVVNMAFRLESASASAFHQTHDGIDKADLALQDRIFLSEHAHDELHKPPTFPVRLVGFFDLKGIAGRHRVFEVLWRTIESTQNLPAPAVPVNAEPRQKRRGKKADSEEKSPSVITGRKQRRSRR
jgi:class 3 adenylate cyclase